MLSSPPSSVGDHHVEIALRCCSAIVLCEALYADAVGAIVVAKARLYPSLDPGGKVTARSTTIWGFGPTLTLPVFDEDLLRANLEVAIATARDAEPAWRGGVLSPAEEIPVAVDTYGRDHNAPAAAIDESRA